MADDFAHLLATHTRNDLLMGYFGDWFARVPVWAVATWGLFASRWLESSWDAAILAFALHAMGLAWLSAALLRDAPPDRPVPRLGIVLAVAAFALYPNVYEILFWPTCMAYSLGSVLLAWGAWARRPWLQALAFALAGLTYETFLLPALCLVAWPAWQATGATRRRLGMRALGIWGSALACVLGVRGAFAHVRGAFPHLTNFVPSHVLTHMWESFGLLLRLRHYRMHTAVGASLALLLTLVVGLVLIGRRERRLAAPLLVGVYASTGLFWVLNYGAIRAVYGAQLLLCALLVWLACHVMARSQTAARGVMGGLMMVAALFWLHHDELVTVKNRNAAAMAEVEAHWRDSLRACEEPCHFVYDDLRQHLGPDWVWPPNYQPIYMEWLKQKYAPQRQVTFELAAPPAGAVSRVMR